MGTIGQDGGEYLERMEKQGIATNAIRTIAHAYTAQCFVTADLDNNQINAFHPGAMQFSHENSLADFLPLRVAIIAPDGRDGMFKHARDCAERGVPFIFDPGQQLPMFNGEELLTFIDQASYLACNDYEFEMVMDRTGLPLQDIASRLDALIVTRGEAGSDIYAGGEHHKIPAVPPASVVDPTGCGDAYRAGLLYGIANDLDWPTTGRLASLLGSIKIAHQGGQNHSFTPASIADQFEAAFGYRF
jgi:adenosine kinase